MAIKYNNQDVKRIYYDGDPVYTLKKYGTIVWKKPYTVRALPSEGEVSFIVDPFQSDAMLQKVSPYKDLIGISPNGISIDGSVIAQRSGYDQRITFHYNPIGKVIDYSSLFWNTEPGGTKVL